MAAAIKIEMGHIIMKDQMLLASQLIPKWCTHNAAKVTGSSYD